MKKCFAVLISLCLLLLPACADETISNKSGADKASSETTVSSEVKQKEIYSDKLVSMSFIGVQDMPNLQGMFLLNVNAKNKSNKKITVYLQDVSINGKAVQLGSGTPCDIMPSKEAAHSFSGKDSVVGISKASEIKKVEFNICITDESTNTIETTKAISVSP